MTPLGALNADIQVLAVILPRPADFPARFQHR
jgi:hypothetical protein